ncbi:MAG: YceI family protein [Hyphomonas sp.]|uniref:YceI family protein n=1 Tax=Hyphomonas sp. TaxID=87 RepID=UPI003528641D
MRQAFGALFLCFSLAACSSLTAALFKPDLQTTAVSLEAGDWKLDPDHAALIFRIDHLGYSDLIGRFDRFEVSLTGDGTRPDEARVSALIDIASLDMGNDSFAEDLKGARWFDAARYPQAAFTTVSVTPTGENTADVAGELTLKGKAQPVTLHVTLNGTAYDRLRGTDVAGFSAETTISRSAFGLDAFSGLVTDDVRIEIEAELLKQ